MSTAPEHWPQYVFLARALSRLDREDVWKRLLSGELQARVYCKGRTDFHPVPLSPAEFSNQAELKDRILDEHTIDVVEMDGRRPVRIRRRIPVPHWIYVTRASLDRIEKALGPKATVGAETRAIAYLKPLLERNPAMSKDEARKECEPFKLSGAGFDDRVWPAARQAAGLSREAPAGRKRRKPTEIEPAIEQIIGPKKSGS
jgi:hypothetical protein